MIKIDIINGSKYVFPRREKRICISGDLGSIVAKSILATRRIVHRIMAWTNDGQLQLDDGGENL
jgi:hypothetical protein